MCLHIIIKCVDYVPALEARAIISLQNMNTFGSLLDINRAIQLEPSAKLYTERGVIHHYMKDVYNAVKDFERAISMDPNLSMAHYNMGNVLLQQKLYRQAIDRYSRVIELTDRSDEALVNRGICFMAIGDSENALCDFNAAGGLFSIAEPIYELVLHSYNTDVYTSIEC